MNIVYLSDCGPFDRYLLGRLREHWPIKAILRVVPPPTMALTPNRRARLRRAPLRTLFRFAEQLCFYRRQTRRLDRQVCRELFGSSQPPALQGCTDVPASEVNSPATIELLHRLAPDVLLVSSAPLLKPQVYSVARIAAVNVHRGITPAFRGESTLFWAMYYESYEHLGMTLHFLDEGIDSGPVLAQGFPAVSGNDDEATLYANTARVTAEVLLEFLAACRKRPSGRALAGGGRLYRSRDRRVWHDARLWLRRNVLRRRLPTCPCRQVTYF
jgi:hypothetical protein